MRKRDVIEESLMRGNDDPDYIMVELLLDMRDLLEVANKVIERNEVISRSPVGRPIGELGCWRCGLRKENFGLRRCIDGSDNHEEKFFNFDDENKSV